MTSAELDVAALGVDDQLVVRDVKARLFDREIPVSVGRYPIERRVGRGGMGTVYEAVDPELGRKVALKMMLPGDANAARTKAEARTLAQLSHPNVVTVHEVGQHGDRVFLAMEYVEGETLGDWLERGPSHASILEVFAQAAEGLAAAHEAGIVHRDFKPSNVLIRADGRVKVIDFGLSLIDPSEAHDAHGDVRLTRTGALLGTPAYMSPEQFRGEEVDARTDVFSFALVLYEALTRARPYAGDDVQTMAAALLDPAATPRRDKHVPRRLWGPLAAALRTDVETRPRSLRPLIEGMTATPRRWLPAAVASLVVAGGIATATFGAPARTVEVYDAPATTEPADPVRLRAFAALRDETDLDARKEAAEAFLATYGDDATNAEQLIAETSIGLALRARSCPSAIDGLCVKEVHHPSSRERCPQAPAVTLFTTPRDPDLVDQSAKHLTKARHLMSFQKPPADPVDAKAYYHAVAQVKLATADDELEILLGTEIPETLDFEGGPNRQLTADAFQTILTNTGNSGQRLIQTYATLKSGDPQTTLRAGGRTALVNLFFVWLLAAVPTPASIPEEDVAPYCRIMDDQWQRPAKAAREAVAYCQENAESHELDDSVCNLAPEGFPRVVP